MNDEVYVSIPCDQKLGHMHQWPLGTTDPSKFTCGHTFKWQYDSDGIQCEACKLFISGVTLAFLKWTLGHKYSQEGQRIADENTRLKTENTEVLAENARLRRRVEGLERRR